MTDGRIRRRVDQFDLWKAHALLAACWTERALGAEAYARMCDFATTLGEPEP